MTVLLISLCNAPIPPPPPPPTPPNVGPADNDDAADWCCVCAKMLVGSVVDTVSIAAFSNAQEPAEDDAALTAAAAAVEAFVVVDDVSAGVWVVVRAAVTFAAVVTIFEHIVDPSIDGVQNVFSLSALGEETSTLNENKTQLAKCKRLC